MRPPWAELVRWWPLGAADTAMLLLGTLLWAQACNLAWERREIASLMSSDERQAGATLMAMFCLLVLQWSTGGPGVPATILLAGAFLRWFVGRIIGMADGGQIGSTWEDVHNQDDEDDEE